MAPQRRKAANKAGGSVSGKRGEDNKQAVTKTSGLRNIMARQLSAGSVSSITWR